MKFGLFFTMDHYVHLGLSPEQHLQEVVEQVQAAEAFGFQTAWFTEQHLNPMDGLCANPIALMSYIAGKTSKIRLGSAVTLAALYNPVYLAEVFALLDVLSGGRIDVGVGTSSVKKTYEVYNVPFDSRRDLRDLAVDKMCSLWGCEVESVVNHGEKVTRSTVPLGLYPLQQPHPPIWITTGALDRAEAILTSGHSLLFDYLFSDFDASDTTAMKTKLSESGEQPLGNIGGVVYAQLADLESAYSNLSNYYDDFLRKLRGPQFELQREWQNLQERGHILCCTVSEAKRRVERIANQGLDQLILGVGFGGVTHKTVISSLEIFAKEVIPSFS